MLFSFVILSLALFSATAFVLGGPPAGSAASRRSTGTRCAASSSSTSTGSTTSTHTDDLLKPAYEVEKIPLRIGHGFDIHRMAPVEEAGQPIVIGGVVVDHPPQKWTDATGAYCGTPGGIYETELGVVAHSDGDVIYHSVVDAIFGALTLPDIGQVFQDTDPRWKGCDSGKVHGTRGGCHERVRLQDWQH